MVYTLYLKFINGDVETLVLSKPHRLVPDNTRPIALVYTDENGNSHNVPFSSLLEFWFNPQDYNSMETTATVKLPTEGCDCPSCVVNKNKIKSLAKNYS